jgi:PPOX class probable F420-dependent enzyme
MTTLDELSRTLLDGTNFATIATVNADGSPQTSVVWVKREGDAALISAISTRRKVRNITKDPRVSLTIFDTANPYTYAEIRGIAELEQDPEKALSHELSHKYVGQDPPPEPASVQRVIIRVRPSKVIRFAADEA